MEFTVTFEGKKQIVAHMGEHKIITDQPVMAGGDNIAPAPFSLFLASLGTCAGIYIKSFCDQRGIQTTGISITQKHNFNPITHMIEDLTIQINLPSEFPEKYKDAVIKVAEQCAVKKHLQNPPTMQVTTNTI
jgi:ribosomal protein S12 methylthiotransferase accessory factor